MSLRELWDTVVLRDILGYIFPGTVTLLALAVLLTRPGMDAWSMLGTCSNHGIMGLFTVIEQHPLLLFPVGAVAYAIGHLQTWIIERLEKKLPIWDNGKLALAFLPEERMGEDYARAGLRLSKLRKTRSFAQEPLIRYLQDAKKKVCDADACALRWLCDEQRDSDKEEQQRREAERQAKEIWRFCDRYVLHKNRDLHQMFMGRYYVLASLFTNLGFSLIALAVSALLVHLTEHPLEALLGACALIALMILLAASLLEQPAARGAEKKPPTKRRATFGMLTIAAASLLCGLSPLWWPVPGASLLLLGIGVLMIVRSSYFRTRFVECTFPIFYAIVQGEERLKGGRA